MVKIAQHTIFQSLTYTEYACAFQNGNLNDFTTSLAKGRNINIWSKSPGTPFFKA